jgi:hypothetical protein
MFRIPICRHPDTAFPGSWQTVPRAGVGEAGVVRSGWFVIGVERAVSLSSVMVMESQWLMVNSLLSRYPWE